MNDLIEVWSVPGIVLAVLWGFVFGWFVSPITDNRRAPSFYLWVGGALLAWWITGMVATQVIAGLWIGDEHWVRILSRLGPYLFGVAGTAVGIWAALTWHRRK